MTMEESGNTRFMCSFVSIDSVVFGFDGVLLEYFIGTKRNYLWKIYANML